MNENLLCKGLFSKTRQVVLSLLYGRIDSSFYTKQILDTVKLGRGTVQRELKNLTDKGIIIREVQGRQVYYRANAQCPIFNELKGIVRKAFGVGINGELLDMVAQRFRVPENRLAEFCRKCHITKLALFGSVLGDDFHPDSDIDVLVEFESGHVPGFGIIDMENELSQLVGRKIDLRTPGDLSRYFRDSIVHEARVKYARTKS